MFQTQQDVIQWVQSFQRFGIKPGLSRVEWMLEQLGNPEKSLQIIHVAGTNGKGSTCKFLACALRANGYKVGLFTSPYLDAFNNRIAINNQDINDAMLCEVAEQVKTAITTLPVDALGEVTEFEIITVLAFLYYAIEKVDYVVLEVGLGGRFDATNVIIPLISVITNIGFDHINILGSSLGEIATEKAGIIKREVPVVSGVQQLEAQHVIFDISNEKKSKIYELGKDFYNKIVKIDLKELEISFTMDGREFLGLHAWKTKLVGAYQANNLSLALATLQILYESHGVRLSPEKTAKGILEATWPGRFEVIQTNPIVVIDGAHNPEGFQALAQSLQQQFGNRKYIWCIGILADKEVDAMIGTIIPLAKEIIVTEPDNDRAAKVEWLEGKLKEHGDIKTISQPNIMQAIQLTLSRAQENDIICIAGSLYMVSEARQWWTKKV
ncbi:hypothetical protein BHU72_12435 [Desulfuribacillus stibiiarsenatis]|uniref:tetrahydrofolate synthase n=1 Tax=Desulfuribacillus stibiiarsenatis TaxID=1390249 RepID=A0A1E5L244_9FIRM|nr:folylpolyglutamate synthase/dihydrofolate synthase family protein [Desulfuribacillus stibiiarsenatis]OEH84205.1 hypothetical protein BHU72_12435 [Desulfuribacillus stibiiarsenatis]